MLDRRHSAAMLAIRCGMACERPVYFVRVDDSPSRLGDWKKTQRTHAADSPVLQVLNRFTS